MIFLRNRRGITGLRGPEKGFALLVVILVMLLTSFLVTQLVMQVRIEQKIAFNVKKRLAGTFLAEAGVSLGLFRNQVSPAEIGDERYASFHEGYLYEDFLPNGRVEYMVVNESGKINLNTFKRPFMEMFLEYHGLDPDQIAVVIDSILDWRDTDDLHRLNGAEEDAYMDLEDPYIPRNGKIKDPAEFFLVNGTDVLENRFDPQMVFTVYNPISLINFNSLSPEMLAFLVEDDEEKIEAYREAQEAKTGKTMLASADALAVLGNERFVAVSKYLTYSSGKNRYFSIQSLGQAGVTEDETVQGEEPGLEEKKHLPGVRITVLMQALGGSNYKYLAWKERYS